MEDIKKKWKNIGILSGCKTEEDEEKLSNLLEEISKKLKNTSPEFNGRIIPITEHIFNRGISVDYELLKKTYYEFEYKFKENEDIPRMNSIDAEMESCIFIADMYEKYYGDKK